MPDPIWGVDSAAPVDEQLLECVRTHYGAPQVWGRYLKTVSGAAEGLTRQEVVFLHRHGIKIMPIFSDFREAVGYRQGRIVAINAIFHAKRLGAPRGVVVFANVERFFAVDDAWIRGWVNTFYTSDYKPGIYHDPTRGGFSAAYCKAAASDERVRTQTVLWSAEPALGVSERKDAPAYRPVTPPCHANVWAWQYGRDSTTCPVDTDLVSPQLMRDLW
jgi:hypothetical protein